MSPLFILNYSDGEAPTQPSWHQNFRMGLLLPSAAVDLRMQQHLDGHDRVFRYDTFSQTRLSREIDRSLRPGKLDGAV